MIVIKFGKWSSRGTRRFGYKRIYIEGKWTPLCKIKKRIYEKGGYASCVGPIYRAELEEVFGEAVDEEKEEVDYMNLKECPRCYENDAKLVVMADQNLLGNFVIRAHIKCTKCGMRTESHSCASGEGGAVIDAIADWNNRPNDENETDQQSATTRKTT